MVVTRVHTLGPTVTADGCIAHAKPHCILYLHVYVCVCAHVVVVVGVGVFVRFSLRFSCFEAE